MSLTIVIVLLLLAVSGFYLGRRRAVGAAGAFPARLHSLPAYHGVYVALWCGVPSFAVLVVWLVLAPTVTEGIVVAGLPDALRGLPPERLGLLINDVKNLAGGDIVSGDVDPALRAAADRLTRIDRIGFAAMAALALAAAISGIVLGRRRIVADLRARIRVEQAIDVFLIACSTIAIFTTVGIVLSLLFEAIRFFHLIPIDEFLFGLTWSPQTALRDDQVGSSGSFGAVPLFAGTLLVTLIAMLIAVPIGLLAAVYMSEYAPPRLRDAVKPTLEVLAGIPTVVYGFFAAVTVAPVIRDLGGAVGLDVASESALAAGCVMGIMIIPFVSSLSDDVINAVPQSLREGSYAMGATKSETVKLVVLPAALPGIVGGVLLAVSRAIGETKIVAMAAGLAARLTANPFEAVTTVTVQIVTLLIGDQEFDSAKTLAAFALGLLLFFATLALNVIALHVVRKYREKYD